MNYKQLAESRGYLATEELVLEIQKSHTEALNRSFVERCFREWKKTVEDLDPTAVLAAQGADRLCETLLEHYGYAAHPDLVATLQKAHAATLTESQADRAFRNVRGAGKKSKNAKSKKTNEAEG